jgi:hypothetical protein
MNRSCAVDILWITLCIAVGSQLLPVDEIHLCNYYI